MNICVFLLLSAGGIKDQSGGDQSNHTASDGSSVSVWVCMVWGPREAMRSLRVLLLQLSVLRHSARLAQCCKKRKGTYNLCLKMFKGETMLLESRVGVWKVYWYGMWVRFIKMTDDLKFEIHLLYK